MSAQQCKLTVKLPLCSTTTVTHTAVILSRDKMHFHSRAGQHISNLLQTIYTLLLYIKISLTPLGPESSSEFLLKSLSSPCEAVGTCPAQKLTGRWLRADVGLTARGLLEGSSGTSWTREQKMSELMLPPLLMAQQRQHWLVTSTPNTV